MDFRSAIIILYLLVARATCGVIPKDIKDEALRETIQLLRSGGLRTALDILQADPELLRNNSCPFLNGTQLGEPEDRVLTAYHLSSFRCYIFNISQRSQMALRSPTLPQVLKNISQQVDSMEFLISNSQSAQEDCRLPELRDNHLFQLALCLLQRLDLRLSNAMF